MARETLPLLGEAAAPRRKHIALTGIALIVAVGILVAATAGRLKNPAESSQGPDFAIRSTRTWDCATSSVPVLNSADVVSYFTLKEGEAVMYGSKEHGVVWRGYTFLFVSAHNKALFEESPLAYIPAWGGFCAWGISREDWWKRSNLGPPGDPNSWLITDDNVLYIFRSETPKGFFVRDMESNIASGNDIWSGWWGGNTLPGANSTGSPVNTACTCNVGDCLDL